MELVLIILIVAITLAIIKNDNPNKVYVKTLEMIVNSQQKQIELLESKIKQLKAQNE